MQVTFIPPEEVNSDLGIVNSARVSLNKKSAYTIVSNTDTNYPENYQYTKQYYLREEDKRLLKYLATHNHWTPFAHASATFGIHWQTLEEELNWYKNRNQAGFSRLTLKSSYRDCEYDLITGSLIGWVKNSSYLPIFLRDFILYRLSQVYPESIKVLVETEPDPFNYGYNAELVSFTRLKLNKYYSILPVTLLVKVPIAVARQIRTSQVGFSYSDYYVEGESFVYNEVSRRYVNDEPEFYRVEKWRVRDVTSVKQGSTGLASEAINTDFSYFQEDTLGIANISYEEAKKSSVAPEQARFLLPQSMYTEFYMTGTLDRWAQFLELRLQKDVQEETRIVAKMIQDCIRGQYPDWADRLVEARPESVK